jgi:hypothetical protein
VTRQPDQVRVVDLECGHHTAPAIRREFPVHAASLPRLPGNAQEWQGGVLAGQTRHTYSDVWKIPPLT